VLRSERAKKPASNGQCVGVTVQKGGNGACACDDPVVCDHCGAAYAAWAPLCGRCGAYDSMVWKSPLHAAPAKLGATETASAPPAALPPTAPPPAEAATDIESMS